MPTKKGVCYFPAVNMSQEFVAFTHYIFSPTPYLLLSLLISYSNCHLSFYTFTLHLKTHNLVDNGHCYIVYLNTQSFYYIFFGVWDTPTITPSSQITHLCLPFSFLIIFTNGRLYRWQTWFWEDGFWVILFLFLVISFFWLDIWLYVSLIFSFQYMRMFGSVFLYALCDGICCRIWLCDSSVV